MPAAAAGSVFQVADGALVGVTHGIGKLLPAPPSGGAGLPDALAYGFHGLIKHSWCSVGVLIC